MLRKLSSVSTIFAFAVLVLAASSAMAQMERPRPGGVEVGVQGQPTLGCCKCLGGTNTLDLSTVSSNNSTVKTPSGVSSPAVFVAQAHPAWNLSPAPAKWVSTVTNGGLGSLAPGVYEYSLKFAVPRCAIDQAVTISGNYGGDDVISVYLDNTTNLISQCTGTGWCFNTSNTPPAFSNYVVPTPGIHTLIVRVNNGGGPSGMFINAKLVSACTSDPVKH